MSNQQTDMYERFGTGTRRPGRIFTDGTLRWQFDEATGALVAMPGLEEPDVNPTYPMFFFRQSGTRWQCCARFPSGATQILGSEP